MKDHQEELFRKLWKFLYSDSKNGDGADDPLVKQAIERMFRVVSTPELDYGRVFEKIKQEIQPERKTKRRILVRVLRYAAVLILPLSCAIAGYFLWNTAEKPQSETYALYIRPQHAIRLTLSTGKIVELNGRPSGELLQTEVAAILSDSLTGISYQAKAAVDTVVRYNTLEVPVAAEYRLQLADGTVVYLNSETSLKYPEVFTGKERRVYLEGEAYFEVAKDAKHPFKVMAGKVEVEVLGTHFNVNAYPEQQEVLTTLAEGKVRVADGARQVTLVAGEQAVASGKGLKVREVDVREFVSWKDSLFIFAGMPLEKIMTQVYRWYGVKATFLNDKVKEYTFTGVIDKNLPVDDLFRVIEKVVDVRFSMDADNHVMIITK